MKKKTTPFRLGVLAYLLILPAFLLINCQNDLDDPVLNAEARLTPDAKVLSLMKEAIYIHLSTVTFTKNTCLRELSSFMINLLNQNTMF